VTSEEIREALLDPVTTILNSVRNTLEQTPPELSSDLMDRGLILAGGGALLRGLDQLLAAETGLPVHVADDPLTAVVLGTGTVLDEIKALRSVVSTTRSDG
jgi:rod shape-determining protein MreB